MTPEERAKKAIPCESDYYLSRVAAAIRDAVAQVQADLNATLEAQAISDKKHADAVQAERERVLEEAAKVCDEMSAWRDWYYTSWFDTSISPTACAYAADKLAERIRALKGQGG